MVYHPNPDDHIVAKITNKTREEWNLSLDNYHTLSIKRNLSVFQSKAH